MAIGFVATVPMKYENVIIHIEERFLVIRRAKLIKLDSLIRYTICLSTCGMYNSTNIHDYDSNFEENRAVETKIKGPELTESFYCMRGFS